MIGSNIVWWYDTKINKNDQKMKIFVYKIDNFLQKMAKIVYFCPKAPQKTTTKAKKFLQCVLAK